MAVPPEKKQKTDDVLANDVEMTEDNKPPEPPKEHEVDAKPLKGKQVEGVEFLVPDTTVNTMYSTAGNLLRPLGDNGLQYLIAGARASVGIKSGRYMFEIKIVETTTISDGPYPRNQMKIGVSTASSSLFLDSEETSASFDSEAYFAGNKKGGGKASQFLRAGDVVACLLNFDKSSPNCNTISLFKNGARVAEPKALPEKLHGEPLFPSVAFKAMTLHTNFGPEPICPLPFKCHMVGSALQSNAEVTTYDALDAGEVLFPVSLPDEGSFDWLDMYLEKNPGCIEISDRAIRDWAEKSAAWPWRKVTTSSKDKPEMGFGIPLIDSGGAKKALVTFCALQKRKYVVMEVKGNLVKEDRAVALEPFKSANFKTSAVVLVGPPTVEFKKRSQTLILKDKQEASDKEHNEKFENAKRKWIFDKKQKELEKARKKAAKEREKALEKAAKARAKAVEEAKKKALAAAEGKEEEDKKAQEEEKEEEPDEEEPEEEEPEEPEPVKEDPPKVALTADDKKLSFRPVVIPDLTPYLLNTTFAKFSLPEKEEGFDSFRYEFLKDAGKCKEFVHEWILSRKLTTRVEDITPSAWFHAVKRDWDKSIQDWLGALAKYKSNVVKKMAEKNAKEAKKKMAAAKAEAAKAKAEADKKNGEEKNGEEKKEEKNEEVVEEIEDDDEDPEPEIDLDDIEVFGVDDVKDVGGGKPLYAEFVNDDWTLMTLAFELHLLGHSFKKDVNDEDRTGMHVDHLDFYYQKYFKKPFVPKAFGKDTVKDVIELVKDVVYLDGKGVLVNRLQGEMESYQVFIKIAEELRRFRAIQIDMGEESAVLKFAMQPGNMGNSQHYSQKRKQDWGPPQGPGGKGDWGNQSWGPPGKKGKGKGWSK